jgi:dTDP-4-dehydrorhamnose 3,5-epimerase
VVSGLVKIVVFDGRWDFPTSGGVNELTLGEKNPGRLIIPPNVYHCWKNIGTSEAIIINMPTRMYNYEAPSTCPGTRKQPPAQYLIAGKPGSP